jgi:hypothetical protein
VLDDVLAATDEATLAESRDKIHQLMGGEPNQLVKKSEKTTSVIDLLLTRVNEKRGEMEDQDLDDLDSAIADLRAAQASGNDEDADIARETIEDILFFLEGN